MRTVSATITFLAQDTRPTAPPPPRPLIKSALLRVEQPPLHFYRYMYDAIGRAHYWVERRTMKDEDLRKLLDDENVFLHVLYIGGVPAGMAELDLRKSEEALIAYFGLVPEFIGRGISPWFLNQVVEMAWMENISRLLVSTSSLDHPRALSTYQRAGFVPYGRDERVIELPPDFPLH